MTPDAHPPGLPRDRRGSLADLDALNDSVLGRSMPEVQHTVGNFVLDVGELPIKPASDPFSADYLADVIATWRTVSGRDSYDPSRDELRPDLVSDKVPLSPSFYASNSSSYVGENLVGIGAILRNLDVRAGHRILEYGAGEGQIALHLARTGCEVSVIDVEERYLRIIELQAKAIGAHIDVLPGLFGDGFPDGRTFDRILFFEAFHHSLQHAALLRRLHDHLVPGGWLVLACEAVIEPGGPWDAVVPYPWGPRLDGLSVNAMRSHGWCELGFREDYIAERLLRSGYLPEYRPCAATAFGNCHIARPHGGIIPMGEPFLIAVNGCDAGWHVPDSGLRWTKEHAILPLDDVAKREGITVEFFNFLPLHRRVRIRLGTAEYVAVFDGGEARSLRFDVPEDANWLEIFSPTDPLSPHVGAHDTRVVGIAVRSVRYGKPASRTDGTHGSHAGA